MADSISDNTYGCGVEFMVQYGCKFFKLLSAIFTVLSQILIKLCVTPEADLLKTTSLETLNCRGLFIHRCAGCATDLSMTKLLSCGRGRIAVLSEDL